MPKVSVIIPCYNLGAFIDEAVDSVLEQTFTDVEIIIVDDGSDDPMTKSKLLNYIRPKTRVIHINNSGVATARNCGISQATGRYILPLDADDRIAPIFLEKANAVLDCNPSVGIVTSRVELFGEAHGEWNMPPGISLPYILLDNQIVCTSLFRKSDWQKLGGYDVVMHHGWEDWDLWLKLLQLEKNVVRLPELLFFYRIRSGSRDRSLSYLTKCRLMVQLMINNRRLYLKYFYRILYALISGKRRRPASIKLNCW